MRLPLAFCRSVTGRQARETRRSISSNVGGGSAAGSSATSFDKGRRATRYMKFLDGRGRSPAVISSVPTGSDMHIGRSTGFDRVRASGTRRTRRRCRELPAKRVENLRQVRPGRGAVGHAVGSQDGRGEELWEVEAEHSKEPER